MRFAWAGALFAGMLGAGSAFAAEAPKVVNGAGGLATATTVAETAVAKTTRAEKTATVGADAGTASNTKPAAPQKVAALTPAAAKPRKRRPTVHAVINLSTQRMTVKVNGEQRHSWKISSGRAGYHTPRGSFRPNWMARMWYSRQYDGAPMPYAVFFNRGIATHGTNAVGRLGRPASHGCIRLRTPNARAFYNLVRKHGKSRVRIVVTGITPARSIPVARRNRQGRSTQRMARRDSVRTLRVRPSPRAVYRPRAAYAQSRASARRFEQRRIVRRRAYRQGYIRRPFFGRPRARLVFPGDRR